MDEYHKVRRPLRLSKEDTKLVNELHFRSVAMSISAKDCSQRYLQRMYLILGVASGKLLSFERILLTFLCFLFVHG